MIRDWLRRRLPWPAVGRVDFGTLRQKGPLGDLAPGAAGALDRHFAEAFLAHHAADIAGRVLELGDGGFALGHGGARVAAYLRQDVPGDRLDLPAAPRELDCILLPGSLARVLDPAPLLRELAARLRPGGVLLATLPGAVQRTGPETCWRFTPYSARLLFAAVFGEEAVAVSASGNVLIALAHAHALPAAELGAEALAVDDPAYPFVIGVRAVWRGAS